MTRTVSEWIGKSDDSPFPPRVIARFVVKQDGRCACPCRRKFTPKLKPEGDHIKALVNDGENRESNGQALINECHALKSKADVAEKKHTNRLRNKHLGIKTNKRVEKLARELYGQDGFSTFREAQEEAERRL